VDEALDAAKDQLPWLGDPAFPAALAKLQSEFSGSPLLARLAQARQRLLELRRLEGEPRREADTRLRELLSGLPRAILGPIQLELAPRFRWTHNRSLDPAPAADEEKGLGKHFMKSRVFVGWTEARTLVCASSKSLAVKRLEGEEEWTLEQMRSFPWPTGQRGRETLSWFLTTDLVTDPKQQRAYLAGSAVQLDRRGRVVRLPDGDDAKDPAVLVLPREEIVSARSLITDDGTDRFITASISPDARQVAFSSERGHVVVTSADRPGAQNTSCFDYSSGTQDEAHAILFLPHERLLTVIGRDENWRLVGWRGDGGQFVQAADVRPTNDDVGTVALALDERRALLGSSEGSVRLLTLDAQQPKLGRLVAKRGDALDKRAAISAALVPSDWGALALLGSGWPSRTTSRVRARERGGRFAIWRASELERAVPGYVLEDRRDGFQSLAVSPDGRYLAAGTQLGEVLVWDLGGQE